MKKQIFIFAIFAVAVSFIYNGCQEEKKDEGVLPKIYSLDPDAGWWIGDQISLIGSGFGNVAADVKVFFSNHLGEEFNAPVVAVENRRIQITVPDFGINPEGMKFFVRATVKNVKTNFLQYTLQKPVITLTSLVPAIAMTGDEMTLNGAGFGDVVANVRVTISDGQDEFIAHVVDVTNNSILITLPEFGPNPKATTLAVTVHTWDHQANVWDFQSNTRNFTLSSPTITELSKNKGVYDDELIITGTNFSSVADENDVYFRGVSSEDSLKAEVVEASRTSLKVIAPRIYHASLGIRVFRQTLPSKSLAFAYDLFGCDSVSIVTADWEIEQLRADVVWKKGTFTAFSATSRRDVNVLEITPGAGGTNTQMGVAIRSNGTAQTTSTFGTELGALAVINGSYFMSGNTEVMPHYSLHHIRIDNEVKVSGITMAQGLLYNYVDACIAFGKLSSGGWETVIHELPITNDRDTKTAYEFAAGINPVRAEGGYDYAMTSGPWLILKGAKRPTFGTTDHWTLSRPRTGVGTKTEGKILLVTVDGDTAPAGSVGVQIEQLYWIMKVLGCDNAMNLDGGGSTTMWIQGKGVVSSVNTGTQRAVANVIYVK